MAPLLANLIPRDSHFDPTVTLTEFRDQWVHPSDVFSVLLILGGDVVARALAQLAGGGLTPITFSFGWVAYSVSAVASASGENKLMPQSPDCKCMIINGKSGYARENSSWIIGRIVRDFDHWSDQNIKDKTQEIIDKKWKEILDSERKNKGAQNPEDEESTRADIYVTQSETKKPKRAGLVVSIYKPSEKRRAGVIERDTIYWSGLIISIVQLGIAAIPCGIFGDWGILLITICGNVLAIATGLLPQWKKEKWACRTKSKDTYVLTRGNGAQHAIVILGNGHGLNLEDLASGQSNLDVSADNKTRAILLVLSTLWVLLLIAAAGLQHNTWFLLAIGAIGMVQNIFVAGCYRRPESFGIPLDFCQVFGQSKVMDTLFEVEESYSGLGRSMLDEFFPGTLRPHEINKWAEFGTPRTQDRVQKRKAQGQARITDME
ncbi:hypothetical protein N7452_005152 [Penicillium brevicompactum]|uniref:Uncharacterized protein n=1 Tax=Penicillium brevicompactum TaxID=5074 RepID=A0A9W9QKH7_PENBR|nr:hypothetical protein N7452_005152 [Penicillium brevicompactum]